jgi:PAS domain-containing protein
VSGRAFGTDESLMSSDASAVARELGITESAIEARCAMLSLTPENRAVLRRYASVIGEGAFAFSGRMTQRFRSDPDLAGYLRSDARTLHLRQQQVCYLIDLVSQPIDQDYVQTRIKFGMVYQRMLLTPPWIIASYGHFVGDHVETFFRESASRAEAIEALSLFVNTLMLDASYILQGYGYRAVVKLGGALPAGALPLLSTITPPRPFTLRPSAYLPESALLKIEPDIAARRARFLEMSPDEIAALERLRPVLSRVVVPVISEFFRWFAAQDEMSFMMNGRNVNKLTQEGIEYWSQTAQGAFEPKYAATRMRLGMIHERSGMPPQLNLVCGGWQARRILLALVDHPDADVAAIRAFVKGMFLDLSFVIDAYMEARVDALLRSRDYARHMVADMPSAVAMVDGEGRIISANLGLIRLLGLDPASLYGRPAAEVLPVPGLADLLTRTRNAQLPQIADVVRIGASTCRLSVMDATETSHVEGGHRLILIDDMTEIFRLAQHVIQRENAYEAVVNATRSLAWSIDISSGLVVSISKGVSAVLGYRDFALLGQRSTMLASILAKDTDGFLAQCQALEPGGRIEIEHCMTHADGRPLHAHSVIVRQEEADGSPVVYGLTMDRSRPDAPQAV